MTRKEAIEYLKSEYDDAKCDDDKYMQEWAEALDMAITSLEVDEEYDEVLKILGKKEYLVSMDVIYTDTVYANSKEEAIEKAINECPYDVEPSCEPYVEEQEVER